MGRYKRTVVFNQIRLECACYITQHCQDNVIFICGDIIPKTFIKDTLGLSAYIYTTNTDRERVTHADKTCQAAKLTNKVPHSVKSVKVYLLSALRGVALVGNCGRR